MRDVRVRSYAYIVYMPIALLHIWKPWSMLSNLSFGKFVKKKFNEKPSKNLLAVVFVWVFWFAAFFSILHIDKLGQKDGWHMFAKRICWNINHEQNWYYTNRKKITYTHTHIHVHCSFIKDRNLAKKNWLVQELCTPEKCPKIWSSHRLIHI